MKIIIGLFSCNKSNKARFASSPNNPVLLANNPDRPKIKITVPSELNFTSCGLFCCALICTDFSKAAEVTSKAVVKFDYDLLIITINGNSHFVQSNNLVLLFLVYSFLNFKRL